MKIAISVTGEALKQYDAHHDPMPSAPRGNSHRVIKLRALAMVATTILIFGVTGAPASADVTKTDEEMIERILELRSEAARLEMELTPEAHSELARRLQKTQQRPPVKTELNPTIAKPPKDAMPRVGQEPTPVAVHRAEVDSQIATDSSPPQPMEPASAAPAASDRCNAFAVFDTNHDGLIDATDRYWRYLYLWRDHDQDGRMTDKEVENPFDLEISGLRADLRFFIKRNGSFGDIHRGEYVVFEHVSSRGVRHGNLVVEASRLKRSDGPQILDSSGNELEGFQILRTGMTMVLDGEKLYFHCP